MSVHRRVLVQARTSSGYVAQLNPLAWLNRQFVGSIVKAWSHGSMRGRSQRHRPCR